MSETGDKKSNDIGMVNTHYIRGRKHHKATHCV